MKQLMKCNVCGGSEERSRPGTCPWCGEGVISAVETNLSRGIRLARGGEAPPLPFGSAKNQKSDS